MNKKLISFYLNSKFEITKYCMRDIRFFVFCFLIICNCQFIYGQETPKKVDSTNMYKNIEKYSKKSKFRKFIYKLIFEPVAEQNISKNTFQEIKKKDFKPYEGKIIRNIKIVTLDPFGNSETDSTQKPTRKVDKIANALHYKTRNFAIKNILLLKKNKPLDSLLVKESERLIRTQRFVRGVVINTELIASTSDSVDVYVRVLDSWSLIPDFTTSSTKSKFRLRQRNFFGTGHEFTNVYEKSLKTSQDAFSTLYIVPNIKNTFIKTTLSYEIDLDGNYGKFIDIERPFFSAFTRWAAGIHIDQQFRRTSILDTNLIETIQDFKINSQDYWAGHSIQLYKGNTEAKRTTNLITSGRFFRNNYLDKPVFSNDTLQVFSNEKLYLMSIGIVSRKFTQDKYLFNFNVVEDVGSGLIYNLTAGYQQKKDIGRLYFGGRVAFGKYFEFGYLSTNFEYGTYISNSKNVQSTINLKTVYFTNLVETSKWKFRQFIKPELVIGINRENTNLDKLNLNDENGIQGFSSSDLFGTKKFLINFQTQGYSPWNVIGFRFNPFLSYTMGMLGNESSDFKKSRMYHQLGIGFIVSNDYLVFSSFQISFSFYPNIPDAGNSIIKTNSFKTYDFGLQTFDLAKPYTVPYQ